MIVKVRRNKIGSTLTVRWELPFSSFGVGLPATGGLRSLGPRGELPVQAHGETLVKNHCNIARTRLHFAFCPFGNGGKLHSECVPESLNCAVIERHLPQPGGSLFQIRAQFSAQIHESAEITCADVRSVNSSGQLQRIRQGLIGSRYPDRAPLRDSEFDQGEP